MIVVWYCKDIFFIVYCYELFWIIFGVDILMDIIVLVYEEISFIVSNLVWIFCVFKVKVQVFVVFLCNVKMRMEVQLKFVLEIYFF